MRLVISKILLKLNYINDQNSFITSVISLRLKMTDHKISTRLALTTAVQPSIGIMEFK